MVYLAKFAPVFPVLALLFQNTKEYSNGKYSHLGDKNGHLAIPRDALCLRPIKDDKVTHFLIQNPTCFPRFPPTTNTNTDIYQQNRSCWKDFLAAEMGSCHQDMAGFLLYCLPDLARVLQKELYVISLPWHVTSCHFPPLRLCCRPQINNIAWEVQAGFAATLSSVFLKGYVRKCKVS